MKQSTFSAGLLYSSHFEIPEADYGKPCIARRSSRAKLTAPAGYGILSVLMLLFLSVGCSSSVPESRSDVQTPSSTVQVEVDGNDGITVDAPGVDVKVGGGDGVQVDAPDTHVKLGGDQ